MSDGGVLVAVTEMAMAGNLGCSIDYKTSDWEYSEEAMLFGEDQNRFILAAPATESIAERAEAAGVVALRIGSVRGQDVSIESPLDVSIPLADLRAAHEGFFPSLMGADAALA